MSGRITDLKVTGDPHDDLTAMAQFWAEKIREKNPELKVIICLTDERTLRNGAGGLNFDDEQDFVETFTRQYRAAMMALGLLDQDG